MPVKFTRVTRENLAAFIPDQRTVLDFELLFDAMVTLLETTAAGAGSLLVPGDVFFSAANAATRVGALPANGAAVSRTTYANLFAAIGTTYGAGDGSTTFNVPDITGRVVAGKESVATRLTAGTAGFSGATLGAAGGDQRLHAHTHTIPATLTEGMQSVLDNSRTYTTFGAGASTGIAGAGASQNVQPTIILNAFIVI